MSSATLCAGAKTRSLYANRHEVSVTAAIVIAMVATQTRTVSTGGNVNNIDVYANCWDDPTVGQPQQGLCIGFGW